MKKVISTVLVLVMLLSITSIVVYAESHSWFEPEVISAKKAVELYEQENGVKLQTHRLYFQMPDGKNGPGIVKDPERMGEKAPSWYHEFVDPDGETRTTNCCIYWWEGVGVPNPGDSSEFPWSTGGWVGYIAEQGDAPNVYYCDVPYSRMNTCIIWSNGINGGTDDSEPIYYLAAQSMNVDREYYWPGEAIITTADGEQIDLYPDGCGDEDHWFNNMIYIIDPDQVFEDEITHKMNCGGFWYRYYGNGCYGCVEGGEKDIQKNCMNPDHNHSYILGDVNMDTVVDVTDATTIQKFEADIIELTDIQKMAADVCGNGPDKISVMDATRIQKYKAKICNLDGSVPYTGPDD